MTLEIKPTRIVKEPEWRQSAIQLNKQVRVFTCDDGREDTIKELAKASGLAESTLYNRISLQGWDSLMILRNSADSKKARFETIQEAHRQRREARQNPYDVTNEWAGMGTRARVENFKRIRPMSEYERQDLGL